jgi:hypothetical protein
MLKDVLAVATASRTIVFERHLKSTSGHLNRPIRRALGLREVGKVGASWPTFVSPDVQRLYKEVNRIAVELLPHDNIEDLDRAWSEGTYQRVFEDLSEGFGYLWTDPMEKRRVASNPASRLLTKGEDEHYMTDLFWELDHHRRL